MALNNAGREIQVHRERLVREIFSAQPDTSAIERERAAIFTLQQAQQRSVIEQLLKEREMLNAQQRLALAYLLFKQDRRATTARSLIRASVHCPAQIGLMGCARRG